VSSDQRPRYAVAAISPSYFDVLNIRRRAGRVFDATDVAGTAAVVVVSESFVKRHFPNESPIGKKVTFGVQSGQVPREIVGVVGDVRHRGLHVDPAPVVYLPHAQGASGALHIVVRGDASTASLFPAVRRALFELNGTMPISAMTTLSDIVADSVRERRFHMVLLAAFALAGVALAALGLYGVISHATAERTKEIGVRVALGATPGDVVRMVLRQGAAVAIGGIAVGGLAAGALTQSLRGMLFGVTPLDPVTFGTGAALLIGVALLATWIPARRASRVDAVQALKDS
jgi:putative ABC transport system permease protein